MSAIDPHQSSAPIESRGPVPEQAAATLVMIHGRGASAESILSLYDEFGIVNVAALAPQARGGTWYPQSFLAPLEANQPFLNSALHRIETVVADLIARGIPSRRIVLLGFSQGACLASEFAAKHPRQYGAIIALTGGLIGPENTPRDYPGSLTETPIFLGTGDPDPHVPYSRVEQTRDVFEQMGAAVTLRRYPGLPHGINEEEIKICEAMLTAIIAMK